MQVVYSNGVKYSVTDIINKIDEKLVLKGTALMNSINFDLKKVDPVEGHLLITYKSMLLNKLAFCADCFSAHNKEEISSKILKILY